MLIHSCTGNNVKMWAWPNILIPLMWAGLKRSRDNSRPIRDVYTRTPNTLLLTYAVFIFDGLEPGTASYAKYREQFTLDYTASIICHYLTRCDKAQP